MNHESFCTDGTHTLCYVVKQDLRTESPVGRRHIDQSRLGESLSLCLDPPPDLAYAKPDEQPVFVPQ
jgi:hypothetical protein